MDSILNSVKKMLGIDSSYTHFDPELIMHINSIFSVLNQLGIGKQKFAITDKNDTWDDFFELEDDVNIENVKTLLYLRVKMIFDPPANSSIADIINKTIDEFEWRLNIETDDWEGLAEE